MLDDKNVNSLLPTPRKLTAIVVSQSFYQRITTNSGGDRFYHDERARAPDRHGVVVVRRRTDCVIIARYRSRSRRRRVKL